MKFYSEITEKLYDTPEELQIEEERVRTEAVAAEQREMERINREAEIDKAIDDTRKMINDFVKDYGYFHFGKKTQDIDNYSAFFRLFF